MSETTGAEADAIRRRYAAVLGVPLDDVRDEPLEGMLWLLAGYDAQREEYLAMGFELDEPEGAAPISG